MLAATIPFLVVEGQTVAVGIRLGKVTAVVAAIMERTITTVVTFVPITYSFSSFKLINYR